MKFKLRQAFRDTPSETDATSGASQRTRREILLRVNKSPASLRRNPVTRCYANIVRLRFYKNESLHFQFFHQKSPEIGNFLDDF